MTINIGDSRKMEVDFYYNGSLTDPTIVTLTIDVKGTETEYTYGVDAEISKDGTGEYSATITIDDDGFWYYTWRGTGNMNIAEEGEFYVLPMSA